PTGPISGTSWLAEERPSTESVQAKAWALLVERFDFPRGDCNNARQRKPAKVSRLAASASRSLVSSRLTLPANPGLCAGSHGRHWRDRLAGGGRRIRTLGPSRK